MANRECEYIRLPLVQDKPKNMFLWYASFAIIGLFLLLGAIIPSDYVGGRNHALLFFVPMVFVSFFMAYLEVSADYTIYGNITLEKETIKVFSETDNTTISLNMPAEIHIIDYESIEFGAKTLHRISGAQNYIVSLDGKFFFHLQNKRELKALRHFLNNQANRDKFLVID